VKVSAFEVPRFVVMVTGTEVGEPVIVGTVTVQDVWTAQAVGAN
jgi:predicted RNA-binding protein with TRAM domain